MQYTEKEIAFLLDRHTVETAMGGERRLTNHSEDLRLLGCPLAVFERILSYRAKQLGSRFTEFRNATRTVERETGTNSLELDLESAKLF
jgi:hypothetical protein